MHVEIHQVDAFTRRPFHGNPAAVCLLAARLDDALMQAIATENNLSETAFVLHDGACWQLRWFTPTVEVDLCGHATLAAAHVLFGRDPDAPEIAFSTRSGLLTVRRDGDRVTMDFPAIPPRGPAGDAAAVSRALGVAPERLLELRRVPHGRHLMAVYPDEATVRGLAPDVHALRLLATNVVVTAPGERADFVSRFFAPASGVDEDPVTGSTHCSLAPYWAERLGRDALAARQVSARGGELWCRVEGDRVHIAGHAVSVLRGSILAAWS